MTRRGSDGRLFFPLIGYGLAGGSGLLINSYWVLLVSRACLGIALAGIFAGINVLILNNYEGGDRDKVMGCEEALRVLVGSSGRLSEVLSAAFHGISPLHLHAGNTHWSACHESCSEP